MSVSAISSPPPTILSPAIQQPQGQEALVSVDSDGDYDGSVPDEDESSSHRVDIKA